MSVNSPIFIVFNMVVNFASWLIFVRFMLQFAEITRKHPLALPIYRLSAVVDMFSRIFPPLNKGRLSVAAVVLLLLLSLIASAGNHWLLGKPLSALGLVFDGTMVGLMNFLVALKWIVIASVILSFIVLFSNKMHPAVELMMQVADAILEPFRRIVPNLGMLDLSPLIAMLVLGLAERLLAVCYGHFMAMV